MIAATPLLPSLIAATMAEPSATPLTRPLSLIAAMLASLVCQVTVFPVNGCPLASWGVAVSWMVCPTSTLSLAGLTITVNVCVSRAAISWHPARSTIPTNTFLINASLRDSLCLNGMQNDSSPFRGMICHFVVAEGATR